MHIETLDRDIDQLKKKGNLLKKEWIVLSNWKTVDFPSYCSQTLEKTDDRATYYVYDDSILWRILYFLRLMQYIELDVPLSTEAKRELRRKKIQWIIKGFIIGFAILIIGIIITVTVMVNQQYNSPEYTLSLTIGGSISGLSLFLAPWIANSIFEKRFNPIYFRKKAKKLFVRVRNTEYEKLFLKENLVNVSK